MILTTLKGERQTLSTRRVMEVKSVPDTLIVLNDGACLMVRESLEEVLCLFLNDCRNGVPCLKEASQ